MKKKRVVVTGLGVVTPLGLDIPSLWNALISGKSGVGYITLFDASNYPTKIAAEVKGFLPEKYFDPKEAKRLDRFAQFALVAADMAIKDANLSLENENLNEIGVLVGSGVGGLFTIETQHTVLLQKGPSRVSPFLIPMLIIDMASGQIAIKYGFKGPNSAVVTACASGAHAIGDAFKIIQRGDASVMIAGGAEAAITPLGLAGFCAMKALSVCNDEPTRASRPFDAKRDGFVMGEGAGIVVLESLDHALARGARIYAEVIGYGMSADAYHITAPIPDGSGATLAMQRAIADAQIKPEQVSYINAHGTSTELNDKTETLAIKNVFGDYAYKIPISSTKSMIGHMLGAAGSVEFIVCVLSVYYDLIHPTINYEFPDPECDLDYVPNKARKCEVNIALSNSLGFGGHNATLIVKKYKPDA